MTYYALRHHRAPVGCRYFNCREEETTHQIVLEPFHNAHYDFHKLFNCSKQEKEIILHMTKIKCEPLIDPLVTVFRCILRSWNSIFKNLRYVRYATYFQEGFRMAK